MHALKIIFILSIFGWILLTYKLIEVPPGINGDEAVIGYNALLVSRSGRDASGNFLPLFTKSPDSIDWKQPVTFYSTSLAFKLFGPLYFTLRAVSVAITLIAGVIIFFLIKELINSKFAIVGFILFITTPIILIQSHLALENIAPVPFISLWLLLLTKYTKSKDKNLLIFAGISLGAGIFSYLGMRMIAPVLMVLSMGYIYYLNRGNKNKIFNHIIWFILGAVPFFVLLLLSKSYYPGAILGSYRPYQIQDYQALFLPYLSSFDLSFLYIFGDNTPYHSTGKHGMFLLATLPLFILGIINIIGKKTPFLIFILISFFIAPIFFGLGSTIHRASRLLALIPIYVVISTFGFLFIYHIRQRILRQIILITFLLLIFVNFFDFAFDYWHKYPERVKIHFYRPFHLAFDKAYKLSKENQLKVYIQHDFYSETDPSIRFFEEVYFPGNLIKWNMSEPLPSKSVLIADPRIVPEQFTLIRYDVGSESFAVFINK